MNWLERVSDLWRLRGRRHAVPSPESDDENGAGRRTSAEALFEAGRTAFLEGNYAVATAHLTAVLDLCHDHAAADHYLGLSHLARERHEDAADYFLMATHFQPDFPEPIYYLGLDARRRKNYGEAAAFFARVAELKPDFAYAHNNLGYTLANDLDEHERGARHIEAALRLSPQDPDILCNYSAVLLHRGQSEQAIELCNRLLDVQPDLHEARLNRALAMLKLGRFAEAWPDYEARKRAQGNYVSRDFGFTEWNGEPLKEKSVLVYAEQGLGDQIMFASCLPDLLQQARRCIVECSPRLQPLFRRSFPAVKVYSDDQAGREPGSPVQLERVDFQVAMGSLPRFFRAGKLHFPRHHGYLCADSQRVEYWHRRLSGLGAGLKIGISWRGGAASTRRSIRSIPLHEWLPLLKQQGCRFVSLQYGDVSGEIAALTDERGVDICHWREAINDYDETAALVCALDLVISVQTATVHLAGGLGRPVWVLVPAVPEWRYLQSGDAMPWYPSIRLLRQTKIGDWESVLAIASSELKRLVATS